MPNFGSIGISYGHTVVKPTTARISLALESANKSLRSRNRSKGLCTDGIKDLWQGKRRVRALWVERRGRYNEDA